jgi:hypothetical protein
MSAGMFWCKTAPIGAGLSRNRSQPGLPYAGVYRPVRLQNGLQNPAQMTQQLN